MNRQRFLNQLERREIRFRFADFDNATHVCLVLDGEKVTGWVRVPPPEEANDYGPWKD